VACKKVETYEPTGIRSKVYSAESKRNASPFAQEFLEITGYKI
jgi:hypothetical protein